MTDREKVIKALEFCTNQRIVDTCYGECPYAVADDEYKCLEMKLDAIALLKEQEAKIGHWIDTTKVIGFPRVECSVCGSGQGAIWMDYCPICGAKMEGR